MTAVLSPCGLYRYRLTRSLAMGDRTVAFIGVNPSTADATTDDATVRKWCGFARRWGYDRIVVVNLFAWRSTDVRALALEHDPIGPLNDQHIEEAIADAALVVPCWGSLAKLPGGLRYRALDIQHMIVHGPAPAQCLGRTNGGDPRHPLMLGYSTALEQWP